MRPTMNVELSGVPSASMIHQNAAVFVPRIQLVHPTDHDLTLVIPSFNEESRLPRTLKDAAAFLDAWGIDYRVIVVDDGSSDSTSQIAEQFGARFSTIRKANGGKGSAVREGLLAATGRVVAFTDADLPFDLEALRAAYDRVDRGTADVVCGSRDMAGSGSKVKRRFWRSVASITFRWVVTLLISRHVRDTQCGLKIFSRQAARSIFTRAKVDGFAFDTEAVFLAHRLNFKIQKVPVILVNEYESTISLSRNALPMLMTVLKLRLRAMKGEFNFPKRQRLSEVVHEESTRKAVA